MVCFRSSGRPEYKEEAVILSYSRHFVGCNMADLQGNYSRYAIMLYISRTQINRKTISPIVILDKSASKATDEWCDTKECEIVIKGIHSLAGT